jgi:ribose 5-phosphate isomerase B
MRISIGADHAGFELKEFLKTQNFSSTFIDKGCYSSERADYPDFAHAVANSVTSAECDFGVLICGSGNGIAMSANKHQGIRAALCWNEEIAALARNHNNANILVLPARFINMNQAQLIFEKFISEKFEGGRHQDRVNKIDCI